MLWPVVNCWARSRVSVNYQKTVLLVEDVVDNRYMMRRRLEIERARGEYTVAIFRLALPAHMG